MASTPAFPGLPAISVAKALASADGTAFVAFYTAPSTSDGGNGVILGRLRATSDDTAVVTLQFSRQPFGTSLDYVLGEFQVPAGSGTNGSTSWADVLASLNLGLPLTLAPGEALRVRAKAAVTTAKTIYITAEAAPL